MGFLKSIGSALGLNSGGTPQYQQYNMDQAIKTQNFGVLSDLGNMSLKRNPDGSYSKVYTSSANDQARNNIMSNILAQMGDVSGADKFYSDASKRINQEFADQRTALDENLINRGIQVGNSQYTDAMGDLADKQNQALNELATQSIFKGQELDNNRATLANILASGRDINALAGMGGTNNAYDNYITQANAQQTAQAAGNLERGDRLLGFLGF